MTMALVSYVDEVGQTITQLAIVGDKNVNLLESRSLGMSKVTTPQGRASKWLTDGILAMAKKVK